MKIKEVCERTGLTRRAVRFYEEKGLISPEIREENEYRDYTEEDVRRLRLVARLRGYRFSVEAIRRLLERPQEAGAVFAAHRQELADEHGETAAILEALDRLRLPADGSPEALNEALCRAEDEGTALPPRDLEPDFGRFEELTRGERDALSRRAAENVRRMEKKRRRRWTALAAAAAVLAAAAGGFGLWVRWETEPVSCVSTIGLEIVYSSGEWDEALSASVAEFEMALPDEEPALYRLRFPDTEAGSGCFRNEPANDEKRNVPSVKIHVSRVAACRMGLQQVLRGESSGPDPRNNPYYMGCRRRGDARSGEPLAHRARQGQRGEPVCRPRLGDDRACLHIGRLGRRGQGHRHLGRLYLYGYRRNGDHDQGPVPGNTPDLRHGGRSQHLELRRR